MANPEIEIKIQTKDTVTCLGDVFYNVWEINEKQYPIQFNKMAESFLSELDKYKKGISDMNKKKWSRQP